MNQWNQHLTDSERIVGFLGIIAVLLGLLWALFRWISRGPVQPDPWDERVAAELEADEAVPLCHHCITPHQPLANFCPECGAPVGEYTNLLPYPYLFSIGHLLRIGTGGNFNRTPLTIIGFFLVGFAEYSIFAPIYWIAFLIHLFRMRSSASNA